MTEKYESKSSKFKRLAEGRTNKAIEAISRIGNLSNRQMYDYEDADAKKVVRALRSAVSEIESRFNTATDRSSGGFKL